VKTFPWLSTMALSWEQYRFKKLRFRYIGRTPTTTPGSLQIAPDYDAQDGQPTSESLLAVMKDTQEDAPWKEIICHCDVAAMNRAYKSHFVMSDERFVATGQDVKTIDAGQVFLACDSDGSSNWGKLWVDYVVDLMVPQPPVLSTTTGGTVLSLGIATSGLTGAAGQHLTATPAQVAASITQDLKQPLVEANPNVTGTSYPLRFLRDWKGIVNLAFDSASGGAGGAFAGFSPTLFLRNSAGLDNAQGASATDNIVALVTGANPIQNLNGNWTNALGTYNVIAKAGDLLGFNPGGLPGSIGTLAGMGLRMILGANNGF
jgi:hypothetical protein